MLRWSPHLQRLLSAPCLQGAVQGTGVTCTAWVQSLPILSCERLQAFHRSAPVQEFISLNNLSDNPGATKKGKRVGRGIGSGKGKTSGRGHKGQKARTGRQVKVGFEGGQNPIKRATPKRGFHNPFSVVWTPLNLRRIKEWIKAGRLETDGVITMKDMRDCGLVRRRIGDGVKLLAIGKNGFRTPVHLQVSQASAAAREAVEKAGGSVTTVYYNKLGLRALLQPDWFEAKGRLLPRAARPPSKLLPRYDAIGSLPPDLTIPERPSSAGSEQTAQSAA